MCGAQSNAGLMCVLFNDVADVQVSVRLTYVVYREDVGMWYVVYR